MAETTADVRRDIELTRNRITDTLQELEQKMNVAQIVKNNPWPALAAAVGAGVLLSGSRADLKAAAATVISKNSSSKGYGSISPRCESAVMKFCSTKITSRTCWHRAPNAPTPLPTG